jgi:uncharacterized membrane protein YfcA
MNLHSPVAFLILFVTGAVVGTFSSVVGGGALITVPVIALFGGVPLASAIATMRLSAAVSQTVTVAAFAKRKDVAWAPAFWISLCCMPGAYLGARLVLHLDQRVLAYVIAALMLILMLLTPRAHKAAHGRRVRLPKYWRLCMGVVAFFLGIYGGFYGAGFSTFIMFMLMFEKIPMLTASGTASVATVAMSVAASLPFLHAHLVRFELFIPMTLGSALGSWYGVGMAETYGMRWLKPVLFLVVVGFTVKLIFIPS